MKETPMFCYQCEQTAKGEGCTKLGVCGKQPEVAGLQDVLTHALKGLSVVAMEGAKVGVVDPKTDAFVCGAMFATLTNVNFDPERFVGFIGRAVELREAMKGKIKAAGGKADFDEEAANFKPAGSIDALLAQSESMEIRPVPNVDADILALQHTLLFGIRGVSAYADHARILGQEDQSIYAFVREGLAALTRANLGLNDWLGLVLKCGEANLKAMEILDAANTGSYGHPVPTKVPLGHKKGKAILISGHDLKDLEELLNRPKVTPSPSTHMARCFPPTVIRSSRSTLISMAITEQHGKTSTRNSAIFPALSS